MLKKIALAVGVLGLMVACGKGGGVEGSYKLDKTALKKLAEAEIAKLPKAEQDSMKELSLAMIDAVDIKLSVEKDGKLKMKETKPSLSKDSEVETESTEGTWTKSEEGITLKADKDTMKCQYESKKLLCSGKRGYTELVFIKS